MEIETNGTVTEIFQKLKTKLTELKGQGRLKQIEKIDFNEASCTTELSGTGFKANVKCEDGKLVVGLDLSLFVKPFRGQIEDTIRRKIKEALG